MFESAVQAKIFRELLLLLRNGPDQLLRGFLDFVLGKISHAQVSQKEDVASRKTYVQVLRNLLHYFFACPDDANWIDGIKVRLVVSFCIEREVNCAKSMDAVYESEILEIVFEELCQH